MRVLFIIALAVMLAGCVSPGVVQGRVSSYSYLPLPPGASFRVIGSNDISLTEKRIVGLVSDYMVRHGFVPSDVPEKAVLTVLYRYAIIPGRLEISSDFRLLTNPQRLVFMDHHDPKTFEIFVLDSIQSGRQGKPVLYWQAELISSGPNTDIGSVAGLYLMELFHEINRTTKNRPFIAPFVPGWEQYEELGDQEAFD